MNSGSPFAKASFALLLLIFGCLVFIIARDYRRELDRRDAEQRAQMEAATAAKAAVSRGNAAPETASRPSAEYAPLRARPVAATPKPVVPVAPPAQHGSVVRIVERPVATPVATVDPGAFGSRATQPADYGGLAGSSPSRVVTGKVLLRGTPPAEKQIALDPVCGRLHTSPLTTRHYVVSEGGGLADVVVWVQRGVQRVAVRPAPAPVLDQVGCEFQPYVMAVQLGQSLVVKNSDSLLHNVHLISATSDRSVGQPIRGMSTTFSLGRQLAETFVRVKCDIHPWMFAYVAVIEHPWFAVTGKDGTFAFPPGLTSGRYTLAAMHPKAGLVTQELAITGDAIEPVTFTFDAPDTLAQSR